MKPNAPLPLNLQNLVSVWARPQVTLPKVIRWKKYVRRGSRRQDTLQHTFSILLFAEWLFPRLRRHVSFDELLVFRALMLHDIGEGEVGGDTLYIDKSTTRDDEEARSFVERFGRILGEEAVDAYLLQFAHKAKQMDTKQAILMVLAERYPTEKLVFDAVERFDYLLYAFEQYLVRKQVKILVQTLRHQMLHFERLSEALPGFSATLWPPDLKRWCEQLLELHEGKWIEQKGEK